MNFKQQIAKYVTGNMTSDQLPEIGVKGLEEGLDTPSLCILAGLNKYDNSYEIEHYFKLALEELNINLPDTRQAAIELALAIVDEILGGKKDVSKGVYEIIHQAIDRYDFDSENKDYCYDSIGFHIIYGLYYEIDDLSNTDHAWHANKSNDQLMTEMKQKLIEELKMWKVKMENA